METDSQRSTPKTRSRPLVDSDKITVDPQPSIIPPKKVTEEPQSYMQEIFNRWAIPEAKAPYKLDIEKLDKNHNETYADIMRHPHLIIPEKGQPLAKEAAALDTVMKTNIIMMQTAAIRTGVVISTSKTLADKWQGLVKSYDNFLTNLKPFWG